MTPSDAYGRLSITVSAVADVDALGDSWMALQAKADCSFFQSWAWVGCLAKERFDDPILLEARSDGQLQGLALFNRCAGGWLNPAVLRLGESGRQAFDAIFVEHNGPLLAHGQEHLLGPCLRAAADARLGSRRAGLILSGVDDACLLAARDSGGTVNVLRTSPAPALEFARLGSDGVLANLSANTRYQIGRSNRRYDAASGPLAVQRARSPAEAGEFLEGLAALHQRTWVARGKPGAFANPAFIRFHRALIKRALPDGNADLLRITAGERLIGFLYNFVFRGRVCAYQSGFDYADIAPHEKPGLTCHYMAIEMYRAEGASCYDFLAGEDRYKFSLANNAVSLHWIEVLPARSFGAIASRFKKGNQQLNKRKFFGSFFQKKTALLF